MVDDLGSESPAQRESASCLGNSEAMKKLSRQPTIRWQLVRKVLLIGIIPTIALTGIACWMVHPIRVWLSGGVWCAEGSLDGKYGEIKYGKECDQPLMPRSENAKDL